MHKTRLDEMMVTKVLKPRKMHDSFSNRPDGFSNMPDCFNDMPDCFSDIPNCFSDSPDGICPSTTLKPFP
ncbi:MAG: hypothetical protein HY040_21785 [Planctomycetes bacterium]|nr:hypothetical protein [Planctomycetota bacterium]